MPQVNRISLWLTPHHISVDHDSTLPKTGQVTRTTAGKSLQQVLDACPDDVRRDLYCLAEAILYHRTLTDDPDTEFTPHGATPYSHVANILGITEGEDA